MSQSNSFIQLLEAIGAFCLYVEVMFSMFQDRNTTRTFEVEIMHWEVVN